MPDLMPQPKRNVQTTQHMIRIGSIIGYVVGSTALIMFVLFVLFLTGVL